MQHECVELERLAGRYEQQLVDDGISSDGEVAIKTNRLNM
jgi:hypothetical protein